MQGTFDADEEESQNGAKSTENGGKIQENRETGEGNGEEDSAEDEREFRGTLESVRSVYVYVSVLVPVRSQSA
jgi:hypothetical protein